MLAERQRHRVVGQHAVGDRRAAGIHHAADEAAVKILDRLHFERQVLRVRNLVDRLDMHVDEVIAVGKGFQGGVSLALVVGVDVAGRAGDLDDVHAHAAAETVDHVDGRDHRRADTVALADIVDSAGLAAAPGPDAVGRAAFEHVGGAGDQVAQHRRGVLAFGRLGARQVLGHRLAVVVVGLVVRDRRAVCRPGEHQQVAVADAGIKADRVGAERVVEQADRLLGVGLGDVSAREVAQDAVRVHGHQVHAEGDVVRAERDALAGRFERAAAAQFGGEIAAEHRHVGHVAGGREAFGQGQ